MKREILFLLVSSGIVSGVIYFGWNHVTTARASSPPLGVPAAQRVLSASNPSVTAPIVSLPAAVYIAPTESTKPVNIPLSEQEFIKAGKTLLLREATESEWQQFAAENNYHLLSFERSQPAFDYRVVIASKPGDLLLDKKGLSEINVDDPTFSPVLYARTGDELRVVEKTQDG